MPYGPSSVAASDMESTSTLEEGYLLWTRVGPTKKNKAGGTETVLPPLQDVARSLVFPEECYEKAKTLPDKECDEVSLKLKTRARYVAAAARSVLNDIEDKRFVQILY